jgi:hypothetical protein
MKPGGAQNLIWSFCLCLLVAGCQVPQWRVFQAKVPAPIAKDAGQIETDRRAADLVARTIETPVVLKPVAAALSQSLGQPENPIQTKDLASASQAATEEVRRSIVAMEEQIANQTVLLAKFEGKAIEGTGFNLFGIGSTAALVGLAALCVGCPSIITFLFFMLRRMRGALTATVAGVQAFKDENPEVADALRTELEKAHDAGHKTLIRELKTKL